MDRTVGVMLAVVLGLLALGAVVLSGHHAFASNTASTVVTDISQLETNARAQFGQGSNLYTSFTTANESAMITGGLFPTDMVRGGAVVDAWGNAVTLAPAANNTEGTISFGGGGSETTDECTTAVTAMKDYVSMTVGGTTFTQANQPDSVSAANACAGGLAIALTFQ